MTSIALTAGEPAGIGPDLIIALAQRKLPAAITIIADKDLLLERAKILDLHFPPDNFQIKHIPCPNIHCLGQPKTENAAYVLKTLEVAAQGCLAGDYAAVVTGPVQKSIINEAGIAFQGHTEFFASIAAVDKTVMLLQTERLRVALATTHIPLKDVADHITQENLQQTIKILHHDLLYKFKIKNPVIHVCGLNPHAGEQGHLGTEEIEVITPVLEQLRQQGMQLMGPLPADTVFTDQYLQQTDCILAMYHDQGLPVLKAKAFGKAANITLGLPFIRTSVDHGTALELAGSGKANVDSFVYAIETALQLVKT